MNPHGWSATPAATGRSCHILPGLSPNIPADNKDLDEHQFLIELALYQVRERLTLWDLDGRDAGFAGKPLIGAQSASGFACPLNVSREARPASPAH